MVAVIKCGNEAWTAYFRAIAFPWMDIVFKKQSELLGIAEAVDAGQLSDDRALLEGKASDERFTQEFNRRMEAEKAALAAERAVPVYVPPPVLASPPPRPNSSQCRTRAFATASSSRTGAFGEYYSNAMRIYDACMAGVVLPPEPPSFTTHCGPSGLGPGAGFTCTTRQK